MPKDMPEINSKAYNGSIGPSYKDQGQCLKPTVICCISISKNTSVE